MIYVLDNDQLVHKRIAFNGKNYLTGTRLTFVSTNRQLDKDATVADVNWTKTLLWLM
jgi:hypothetical protein